MKKDSSKNAFTLIEMLVVIAIFGVVAGGALIMMNGTRDKVSLESAQATVLSALERARNQSATGYGTENTDYGVYIDATNNKLFSFNGPHYDPATAKEIALPSGVSLVGSNQEILFNRLSATSSANVTIKIHDNISGKDATITVNTEGNIEK